MIRETRLRRLLDTAETHARGGRRNRAVSFYRKVLALTQDGEFERELAHVRLADLHLALGQAESAALHVRRAIALSGGEPDYALVLGRALLAQGRAEEAMPHLHEAMASPVRAAEALAALAHGEDALGNRRTAGHLARLAAERDPSSAAWRALARDLADA
jgi:tetratricopeptide (TPR) repeat protein